MMDDGILKIYEVKNKASPGDMPGEDLFLIAESWYGEKTVGITRYFEAQRAGSKVDRVVETWEDRDIITTQYCRLNNDKEIYKILLVQHGVNDDGLRISTLTLEKEIEADHEFNNNTRCPPDSVR